MAREKSEFKKVLDYDLKVTQKEFCESLGISEEYLCRVKKGKLAPGPEFMRKIEQGTGGKISKLEQIRDPK